MTAAILLLSFVTLERLAELWLARRNTAALMVRGAVEYAPDHYPLIVLLHTVWLAGLWWQGWDETLRGSWLGVFIALQIARVWVLATLGSRWTTRIIVLPGAPLIRRGPYRFLSHPNYCVVVGEIAVLPLVFGLPLYALAFSVLNAVVLTIRIRAEQAALGQNVHGLGH